jgi:predicted dehydrogenase
MRKLNIALVGYGFMGKAHSNAWRQVRSFFEVPCEPVLKVICGRDEAKVSKAARSFGWEEFSTSWESIVSRKDIDIVDICSPGDTHHPITLAAAEAGKIILCEKPLANSLADAKEMLAAVQANNCLHMICHNYRRAPAVALARELITRGRIGKVNHYRGTYLQDWLIDPNFPRLWRMEKARAGSGALGDLLSHSIDLARYLVGEITEVSALLKTFISERPNPETDTKEPVEVDDAVVLL